MSLELLVWTVALRAAVIPSDYRRQGRQLDVSVLNDQAYAQVLHVTFTQQTRDFDTILVDLGRTFVLSSVMFLSPV